MADSPYTPAPAYATSFHQSTTSFQHSMGKPITSQRIVPASHVVVRRTRGIEVFVSQDNFNDDDMSIGYSYKFNDSNMEDAFQVFYFGGFNSMRVAALLSSILALMIVVYSIGSEDPPVVTILWLLFCVQLCLFLMLLLVAPVKMLLRLLRTAIMSLALTTSITVSLAHVISIKTLPNAHPSTLGLLLLGLLTVVRPRFLTSAISMALGLASYIVVSLAIPAPGWGLLDWGSRVVELLMIISVGLALLALSETYSRRMFLNGLELERQNREAEKERKRTETLLENVLPQELVSRVMAGQKLGSLLHVYPQGTVVQSDICNFTVLSDRLPAACIIGLLDLLFTQFDSVCKKFNVEKIKTVGDAYIAADFLHNRHLERIIDTALCFVSVAKELAEDPTVVELTGGSKLSIRVGIGSGSILADVIGYDKCVYDVFGEAPDEAAIMESTAEPMLVHCTSSQMEKLIDKYIVVQHSGKYYVEGKKNLMNSGWEEDVRQPIVHSNKGIDDALCPDPLTFIFSKSDPSLQVSCDETQPELHKWTLMFKDSTVEKQAINYLSAVSSKHSLHLVGLGAWVYFIFPLPILMLFPSKAVHPALIVAYISYCLFGVQAIFVAFRVGIKYSRNLVEESGIFSPQKLRQQAQDEQRKRFRLSLFVLITGFICSATSIILVIGTFDHAHSGAMVSFPIATTLMYFFSNYHLLYWVKMIFGVTYFVVLCVVYIAKKDVARSPAADLVTFLATFLLSMLAARHLEYAYRRFFLSHRSSVQKGVEIQRTQQWGELLLETMIPTSVVQRLRNNVLTADEEFATCMFVSIHGASGPELNIVLYHLDALLVDCYSVEKIKSRPFLVASGIPEQCPDHANRLVELAFMFHKCAKDLKDKYGIEVALCIGLNSGTISAGLVGDQKWIYDIFGDTVNTASRLTGVCEEGKTTISETTKNLLGSDYYIQDRNMIDIKGKGYMHCFYVSPQSTNQLGTILQRPPAPSRAPVVVMEAIT